MTKIHPTAVVSEGAIIGKDVDIGPYSIVGPNLEIGDGTKVMPHVFLDGRTKIGKNCIVYPFASIGTQTQDLKYKGETTYTEIGDRTILREYVTVTSGTKEGEITKVGSDCALLAYCHVAHGCVVGNGVIMSNAATLAGEVIVEDQAVIGGFAAFHQFVRVGRLAMIGACSKVTQDCLPFMITSGTPPEVHGPNAIGLQRRGLSEDVQKKLKLVFKLIFRSDLSTTQAVERIKSEVETCPEVEHVLAFIASSQRGITK